VGYPHARNRQACPVGVGPLCRRQWAMLAIFGQAGQRYRSAPEERFQVYQATEKAEVNRDQETHEQQ